MEAPPPEFTPLRIGEVIFRPDEDVFPERQPGAEYLAAFDVKTNVKLWTVKIADPLRNSPGAPQPYSAVHMTHLQNLENENAILVTMQFGKRYKLDLQSKTVTLVFNPFEGKEKTAPVGDMPPRPKR
ncbi:hypothetical protein V8J88_13270 [Massilia sp. W12]|uniref:hypothetical protein n=1 Tax=Massilia sp. W12 TaxID=3126507 RepID=UPI0030D44FFB